MSTKSELACVDAALILVDADIAVIGEKVSTILKASNVEVEPYWAGLFAKSLDDALHVKDLINNIGSGVSAAPDGAAAAPAAGDDAPTAETKKEEKKKEEESDVSDDDMGFGLFD